MFAHDQESGYENRRCENDSEPLFKPPFRLTYNRINLILWRANQHDILSGHTVQGMQP